MRKKQVTQDLKRVQYNYFKAKKKKTTKQAKIRNILFRGGYVNSKKKKSLCCFLLCSVVLKEDNHRHISGSQLLLLWRQRAEGKRPIADAKILGKNTS